MSDANASHEAILAAAKRLFVEQGFRGISMRQIAEAVGVTKAALYYHFQDKEDLFVAIVAAYLNDMAVLIDQAAVAGHGSREQICAIVRAILTQPVEQRAVLRLASQELSNVGPENRARFLAMYQDRFIGRIAALLETGMVAGELRPLDPALATWTLLGMMYPYFQPTPPTGAGPSAVQIDGLLSIYFDGLGAPQPAASSTP